MCGLPTAPYEAELESYIKRIGARPLEADRLRRVMMRDREEYSRVVSHPTFCGTLDVAKDIARLRALE
jgi:hypothetical protein